VLLARSDPGYPGFGPLLTFNTGMGAAYVAVGAAAWRSIRWGRNGAGAVLLLNLAVWLTVLVLGAARVEVAAESLRAMGFRRLPMDPGPAVRHSRKVTASSSGAGCTSSCRMTIRTQLFQRITEDSSRAGRSSCAFS